MTDDRSKPLRRDAEHNRQRILDAAAQAFAEHGVEATFEDVARRAGVGVGTVYRRFPHKEALLDALFFDRIAEIVSIGRDALQAADSWQGFVDFVERINDQLVADRGLREVLLGSTSGRERIAQARDGLAPVGAEIIERARRDGYLREDFSDDDMTTVFIMIGAVADYSRGVRPEAWRRPLTFLLDGLRARRDAPTSLPGPPIDADDLDRIRQHFL